MSQLLYSQQLTFSYPDSKPIHFKDVQIDKGKHTLLLGESGSGKTTLLHLLGGLSKPSSGIVTIDGCKIYDLSDQQRDAFRAANMGFIFQDAHLLQNLTIEENIRLAQYLAKHKQDVEAIHFVLDKLQIKDKAKSKPNQLSRGQLQRAAIARAVINKPKLLIADEPTASLDDTNTQNVMDLLLETAANYDATLLVATHDSRIKSSFENTYQL